MSVSRTKVEAGTALVAAGLGVAGAILLEPLFLLVGAAVAGVATAMRIIDAERENPQSRDTHSRNGQKVAMF